MGSDRIRCLGRRKAWSSEVVGDYARSGGSGEGAAVPEADGNTVTCFGPTDPEISRYCWCQDPQRPGDKYQGSGQGAQISS